MNIQCSTSFKAWYYQCCNMHLLSLLLTSVFAPVIEINYAITAYNFRTKKVIGCWEKHFPNVFQTSTAPVRLIYDWVTCGFFKITWMNFQYYFECCFCFNCNNYLELGLTTNCFHTPLENIYGKIKLRDISIISWKLCPIWVWLFAQSQ